MLKVLEVNVDDIGNGGVYSLVKSIIINNSEEIKLDIAAYEKFEREENVKELKQYNSDVYYVGYEGNKAIKLYMIYKNIKSLLNLNTYDCVHIHGDLSFKLYVAAKAAREAEVERIILHAHASGVDGNGRKIKKALHILFRDRLRRYGTTFVSCSDLASEWMFPSIEREKIIKINNGINLELFRFKKEIRKSIRKTLVHQEDVFLVGHVGRFSFVKNHDYIIEVFSYVATKIPNARLLLIGEGNLKETIENKVKSSHLEDKVIFYGISSNVNELLQAMDVFLLPSFSEGFPIVGVEAQATGLPVIFSDVITREAALIDRVEFFPIDIASIDKWGEEIISVYKHPANEQFRENAYVTLKRKKYDLSDVTNSFYELYKK